MTHTPTPTAASLHSPTGTGLSAGRPMAAVSLAAAVAAGADWLLWDEQAGVSLAILGALVAAATLIANWPERWERRHLLGFGAAVLAMAPVVEYVQPLSVAIWTVGLVVMALMFDAHAAAGLGRNLHLVAAFPVVGFDRLIRDIDAGFRRLRGNSGAPGRAMAAWLMPALLGSVFLLLFAAANPVIETWIDAALDIDAPPAERIAFWAVIVALIWPFLRLAGCAWPISWRPPLTAPAEIGANRLVTRQSVQNGLILFNALFALQTALDVAYLWGGAALPQGMTYAEYAHRGAYPLVATALLAGAIVIFVTTYFRPGPLMRWLILLWIGQNVLLLGSSVLRLNLYVSVYSLTHLRIAAFIWMGLVAAGFLLLVARLVWGKSNAWLLGTNAALAGVTLYACCFVNFADIIARYNIAHSMPVMAEGRPLDEAYLCGLGPQVLPAVMDHAAATGIRICPGWSGRLTVRHDPPTSWRGWGLRDWRLERYLAAMNEDANEGELGATDHGG